MNNVGIIGLGNVGKALFKGIKVSHNVEINVSAKNKNLNFLDKKNIYIKNEHLINDNEIIFICVRTNQVNNLLEHNMHAFSNKTLVLCQAGIQIDNLAIGNDTEIHRILTNINSSLNKGLSVILKNESAKNYDTVLNVLKNLGKVIEVENENNLEKLGILPGCSPALVGVFYQSLKRYGLEIGFEENEADAIAYHVIDSTIDNIQKNKIEPEQLAKSVASPGGNVEKALNSLLESNEIENSVFNFFNQIKSP